MEDSMLTNALAHAAVAGAQAAAAALHWLGWLI